MANRTISLSEACANARSMIGTGRVEQALALWGQVLRVDPNYAAAYADRGTAHAMLKRYDEAISDLTKAFALGSVGAPASATLATVYAQRKQFDQSLEWFGRAISIDPSYAFTYYNRADVYAQLGNTSAAVADYERCLTLDPDERLRALILDRVTRLNHRGEQA